MTCPKIFHECASKIASGQIEKQIDENDKGETRPEGGRAAQFERLLKLWSPFGRKSINLAIVKEDNSVTTNSDEAADASAACQAKVFTEKITDTDKVKIIC